MQTFTVAAVRKTRSWANGIEAHLDGPVADLKAAPRSLLTLVGWIVSSSEKISEILLACRGQRLAVAKWHRRTDVEEAYAGRTQVTGFEINAVPVVFWSDEPLKVVVEFESGRTTALFEIDLCYADEPAVAPLDGGDLVLAPIVALPRSGTTYLAQLLHTSDAVLGDDQYPYELRFAEHFATEWFGSLQPWAHQAPADRGPQTVDPNFSTICSILGAPGSAPVEDLFNSTRTYYRDKITQLYRLAAPKPAGRVIVEKVGLGMALALIEALTGNVRPIFLVRDPRDSVLSMRSFNDKRGVYEFHEVRANNFAEVVYFTSLDLHHLVQRYDGWKGDKLLLRYDDLILQPAATLRKALEFIGADPAPAHQSSMAPGAAAVFESHITASSSRASVGRWKHELSPSEAAFANWHFRPFLERFDFF